MMHHTTVATICTPAIEKVMASWDLGDTREGRAADLLAILNVSELVFLDLALSFILGFLQTLVLTNPV